VKGKIDIYGPYHGCLSCETGRAVRKVYNGPMPAIEDKKVYPSGQQGSPNSRIVKEMKKMATDVVKKVPTCRHHPDRPALIGKDGKSQGLCQECKVTQVKSMQTKEVRSKVSSHVVVHLGYPEYAELRKFLLSEAKDQERTLQGEIIFILKIFMQTHKKN